MLPGKTYGPEDYLWALWRRKWVGIVPAVLISAGVFVWAQSLPDVYQAEARILIVPQRVPESYVRSTVTSRLDERLQALSQDILSRTRLERLIQEFNLYPEQRKTMIMEDVIERMRLAVKIDIARPSNRGDDPGYFALRYQSENARTAMQVTDSLASMFITENLQERSILAEQTTQFLNVQLEDARRKLSEHEKKLEGFRLANAGRLPTQVETNLQGMQAAQFQLQTLADTINRDLDRQLVLDRMIADTPSLAVASLSVAGDVVPAANLPAAEQLAVLRAQLAGLRLRLKAEHPDVIRIEKLILGLEKKAEQEALVTPVGQVQAVGVTPAEVVQQRRLLEMRAERESLERRIAQNRADETRLQRVISEYRARVEASPGLESQQIELMRDYDTLNEQFATLLTRTQESKIAADLERRQIGEQFRVIDSPRVPEKPISPDRDRLNMLGLLAGLGFGVACIALLEYRDTTIKTVDDVAISLSLPVLAVIPAMLTTAERAKSRYRRLLFAAAGSLAALIAIGAAAAWKLRLLDGWIR